MKKLFFVTAAIFLMASCSGNGTQEKLDEDSNRIADSIAQVEAARQAETAAQAVAEQARRDSIRQDSIMKIQIDEEYHKGLVLESSKSKYRYIGDATVAGEFSRDCKIINNTSIDLSDADYQITYQYEDLDTIDGELYPVKKNKSIRGRALESGEAYDFVIKIIGDGLLKPSVKMKISKKEFEKRFKENTVFDSQLDMFVAKRQEK